MVSCTNFCLHGYNKKDASWHQNMLAETRWKKHPNLKQKMIQSLFQWHIPVYDWHMTQKQILTGFFGENSVSIRWLSTLIHADISSFASNISRRCVNIIGSSTSRHSGIENSGVCTRSSIHLIFWIFRRFFGTWSRNSTNRWLKKQKKCKIFRYLHLL